ncbi:subtilisin-like protease SBT5.3 [Aegilops tauschii subsp. strangulata]|uniref:Subtilisin-like protease n=3 Tax=Aegilops tauschii subsp. strangulata TaxID=200361 RepID=A0A453NKR0_AEGTS|nr:subtilisin-like protease SBT5.3 [Aegilops tauschii subsp. strangulata]XP_044419165.1 subtilisin-like protease SBT5.3 [Triticum aestivum]
MRPMASFGAAACFLLCALLLVQPAPAAAAGEKRSYVVYLGEHAHASRLHDLPAVDLAAVEGKAADSHYDLLATVLGDKAKAREAIFYSYTKHINGFAANLDADEAAQIARLPEVVSVFRNRGYQLHTTRSWQFLGIAGPGGVPRGASWRKAKFGEGVVIGNIDTGVWPESESFRDHGLGPVPKHWKGTCEKGQDDNFHCNAKLIGARYFNKGYGSEGLDTKAPEFNTPRDNEGHGTHTLSTAGGSAVPGASVFGFGNGTASGGSPRAHVAAYRVCYKPVNGSSCFEADILAAFDAAIHDGVHVLSVSLGNDGEPYDYFDDAISIGSFHAVRRGISVVCSAGNSGPKPSSISNLAPWVFTVGASTMDREFPSYVVFNGTKIKGQSMSETSLKGKESYPMIDSAEAAAPGRAVDDAKICLQGSLDPEKVKGKIVVCLRGTSARVAKGLTVLQAGGAAMVLANDAASGNEIIADAHLLPATHIRHSDGLTLYNYLKSAKSPEGYLEKPETILETKPAPYMAAFSSQGPNPVNPEILKPDITAPGVSVIAAFTRAMAPTELAFDERRVAFTSMSGTSMSCPHVSGLVGLLKALHPDWSPSAIKSAMMTTAIDVDNKGESILNASLAPAGPFAYGAGHVWPSRSMNPGLVYDLGPDHYLDFLCALKYNATVLSMFNGEPYKCPEKAPKIEDLNYPSITVVNLTASGAMVKRTVKNVGSPCKYKAMVRQPAGVHVTVSPDVMEFGKKGEEKTFEVKFETKNAKLAKNYAFGALIWSNGVQFVKSPIVVKTAA